MSPCLSHSIPSLPILPSPKLSRLKIHNARPFRPTHIKLKPLSWNLSRNKTPFLPQATETDKEEDNANTREISELGEEINKEWKEKQKEEEASGGLLSGVVEEIGQIEWPEFGKVVGTTGVVLGVIVGSSVVLLTVNAVLAEISDTLFAGKGIQDFFG